ncbi:hypothetical protein ABW19_dt0206070 [Dactylella cylindrospora]|nr:hypothetical protein ABW19_dt0206070 [Dactylella cylindrospora]
MVLCLRRRTYKPLLLCTVFGFIILELGNNAGAFPVTLESLTCDAHLVQGHQPRLLERDTNTPNATVLRAELPIDFWRLFKDPKEVEVFRERYNLTIVTATPVDAAYMPSWQHGLIEFIFMNPPFRFLERWMGIVNWTFFPAELIKFIQRKIRGVILLAFVIIWVVAWMMVLVNTAYGGWLPVLNWVAWLEAKPFRPEFAYTVAIVIWSITLVTVMLRWIVLGKTAYVINDWVDCTPSEDWGSLGRGVRSNQFRILQTVTWSIASLAVIQSWRLPGKIADVASIASMLAFAEFVFTIYVAMRGTPMVVSGNCLLVEQSPALGFLDSSVPGTWKRIGSIMGY